MLFSDIELVSHHFVNMECNSYFLLLFIFYVLSLHRIVDSDLGEYTTAEKGRFFFLFPTTKSAQYWNDPQENKLQTNELFMEC